MANASDDFRLASSGIDHEGRLPRKYTSEGQANGPVAMTLPVEELPLPSTWRNGPVYSYLQREQGNREYCKINGAKKDISPPLEWYNVPNGTKILALVVEDIDAPDPNGPLVPWTLWVMINIPPTLKGLPEGFSGKEEEMGGDYANIKEGNNDFKVPGWRSPTMPSTGHRFEFKLYALDDEIDLGHKVTKEKLLEAIDGHVLGVAVLVAIY